MERFRLARPFLSLSCLLLLPQASLGSAAGSATSPVKVLAAGAFAKEFSLSGASTVAAAGVHAASPVFAALAPSTRCRSPSLLRSSEAVFEA